MHRLDPSGAGLLRPARMEDLEAAHAIRLAAAHELTQRFGEGHWSHVSAPETLAPKVDDGTLFVAEVQGAVVGTVLVTARRIVFYRPEWFAQPLAAAAYLMDMSVHPVFQRRAVGREMMRGVEKVARSQGLTAIRLDAYQGPAGAGPFYGKCGYARVHSGSFRGIDLDYYEKVLVAQ